MSVATTDPSVQLRPLRRSEYHRLAEDLVEERVELIEGVMITAAAMGDPHATAVMLLNRWFARGMAVDLAVRTQLPLAASDISEPEPDLAIVPFDPYTGDHPSSALLVVEVTATSHVLDLQIKPRVYAAAGVPRYWVVDLPGRRVIVHDDLRDGAYRQVLAHGSGTVLSACGVTVDVTALLPPA